MDPKINGSLGAREAATLNAVLQTSRHAQDRFIERGGRELLATVNATGVRTSAHVLLLKLVHGSLSIPGTREYIWDTTVKKDALLVRLAVPHKLPGLGLVVSAQQMTDLTALLRDTAIVTVLTSEMVANNKRVGMFYRADRTPFPRGVR